LSIATTVERYRCTENTITASFQSSEEYSVAFNGTLDSDKRWVNFSALMPWIDREETYATQFNRRRNGG
jgi:hypothetical protein